MDINSFSTPINKTAALVVQQPTECDMLALEQEIISTRDACRYWHKLGQLDVDGAKEKTKELSESLKKLKHRQKVIRSALSENMESYIVKQCKKQFSQDEWDVILFKARQQWASELDGELDIKHHHREESNQ
jgi:hypothetical protein